MTKGEAEPEDPFSPEQWDKIARSIPLDELPREMKQEICDALFAYHVDRLADHDEDVQDDHDNEGEAVETEGKLKGRKKRHKVAQNARERDALRQLIDTARAFRL